MRKLLFIALCCIAAMAQQAAAQCPAGRYLTEIFPTVNKTTVTYSSVYNLQMDIYQPAGDTLSHRPVIILAHGGSFISDNKSSDPTIDSLCLRFAKRGYVTASIDYRLTDLAHMIDSASAIDEVIKAMSDGKAAIRYFVKDAYTTNTYKIDTNNVYVGGNSAGAVLYMHVTYLDSLAEAPSYIAGAMATNGGFEGNSGNAGYTTITKGVINLAGALNMSSFITPGSKPSANAQGTTDNVVPYNCGRPLGTLVPVQLCGLGVLEPVYVSNGVYHMSHIFPGDGHVPWSSDNAKLFTIDSMIKVFLYNLVCTGIASVNETDINAEVSLFPNPATDVLNVQSAELIASLSICDQTGRQVYVARNIAADRVEINMSYLSRGLYFARISFTNGNTAPVVRRVVIE